MKPRNAPPALSPDPQNSSTSASGEPGSANLPISLDSVLLKDVEVELEASLGVVHMAIGDLLALNAGSVLSLQTGLNELVELRLNQSVVARGEIVAVDDNFGLRIVELAHTP